MCVIFAKIVSLEVCAMTIYYPKTTIYTTDTRIFCGNGKPRKQCRMKIKKREIDEDMEQRVIPSDCGKWSERDAKDTFKS